MTQRSINILRNADARVRFAARVRQFEFYIRTYVQRIDGPSDGFAQAALVVRECFALHLVHLGLPDSVQAFMLAQFGHIVQSDTDQIIRDVQQTTDAVRAFEQAIVCYEDCVRRRTSRNRRILINEHILEMSGYLYRLFAPRGGMRSMDIYGEIMLMFKFFEYVLIVMAWALWSKLALINPFDPPMWVTEMATADFIVERGRT